MPEEFILENMQTKHLKGGYLKHLMSHCMLPPSSRKSFMTLIEQQAGKHDHVLEDYRRFYGYLPPRELMELSEAMPAYMEHMYETSDIWVLEGGITYVKKALERDLDIGAVLNSYEYLLTMLTGMELIGRDPCGDSCYLNTLPHPLELAEVIVYDHEVGKPSGFVAYSIADFVQDRWLNEDMDDEDDNEAGEDENGAVMDGPTRDHIKSVLDTFNKELKQVRAQRPFHRDAQVLFKRSQWLFGFPAGEPGYGFAKDMADAPVFEDWEKEKDQIGANPVLANYWLLTHYFLGNTQSCREAVVLAGKCDGLITPALAALVENLLDNPQSASMGEVTPQKLEKLRKTARANCSAEQLEPEQREILARERGEHLIKKLSKQEFQQRIKAGEDPMAIIAEFPDDVATHDLALKAAAKTDETLAKLVDRYFSERKDDAYNTWPYGDKPVDARLHLPVCAAFRAGLKFDADHKQANAGIAQTLAKIGGKPAMDAYRQAFECLQPDDDRIEYIIKALKRNHDESSREVMRFAAWRFFEALAEVHEKIEKRNKAGNTLDNIFDVDSYLIEAVKAALDFEDAEAEKLANKLLQYTTGLRAFGTALGRAFRIAGRRNMQQHLDYALGYSRHAGELEDDESSYLDEDAIYNVCEATIAAAKLAPDTARTALEKLFAMEKQSHHHTLDLKACALAGLLIIDPDNDSYRQWLHRFIGNRSEDFRVYAALRGVEETGIDINRDDLWFHIFADPDPMVDYSHLAIEAVARRVYRHAHGEAAPEFDDSDEYATGIADKDLPDAILQMEKYSVKHVFEKIHEEDVRHADVVSRCRDFLLALLKHAKDQRDRGDDKWEALKAMSVQGNTALHALAEVARLPELPGADYTDIIYVMSCIKSDCEVYDWLHHAQDTDILAQLADPSPEFLSKLDILAAEIFARLGRDAFEPIREALSRRYDHAAKNYAGWEDEEPTITRLPVVFSRFGERAIPVLTSLRETLPEYGQSVGHIEKALKLAKKFSGDKPPPVQPITETDSTISLLNTIKGEDYDEPCYRVELELSGTRVILTCRVDDIGFQSLVKEETLENRKDFTFADEQQAMAFANRVAMNCQVAGYKIES